MRTKQIILISVVLLFFAACKNNSNMPAGEQNPKVQVKTARISIGNLPDYLRLTGKTIYLNKNNIVAPISGYITKVNIRQGDRVSKGKVLFEIQTPEAFLIKQKDSLKQNFGIIKIVSPSNGIVSGLTVMQKGIFTDGGSVMCIITASGNLKVKANVPFEYSRYAKIGDKCMIVLPDSTVISSRFSKILPQMNEEAQTEEVFADLKSKRFIPENMIVTVLIDMQSNENVQILAKNCVMTDALMKNYWVMKLINDSTAVQVPIKPGKQNHLQVEILSPQFSKNDRIISEGAYGLEDTVLVEIVK